MSNTSVAVIGLGAAGLAAIKNLKEEGFDVTGFERNSYIGGLWKYSEGDQTSALESTVVNISKQRGCFTDFPFPDSLPSHPTAAQVHEYLLAYAEHFDLEPHFRLNSPVEQVTFDDASGKWAVNIRGQNPQYFDKVVIASGGTVGRPNLPKTQGTEYFTGTNIHAQSFKHPKDFQSKRVVVIGCGNSAADIATLLVGTASKVYLAHRHGARILPRRINSKPIDHTATLRLFTIQSLLLRLFPFRAERQFDLFLKRLQDKAFKIRPEWRLDDAQKVPIVSDTLVPCLENGSIISTPGLKTIVGASTIELDDGAVLEDIDALIWCTGYISDFSIVEPRFDPSINDKSSRWTNASGANGRKLFKLWHNIFSVKKPESLAFLGNVHWATSGLLIFDQASMAIAQLWSPTSPTTFPPPTQIVKDIETHHNWIIRLAEHGHNVSPANVQPGVWTRAMDDLGGTGINEYLGYGLKGWWFWLTNMKFCNLMMGGIWSPHIYRVFEGRRKAWSGAREAIDKVNQDVNAGIKKDD